MAAALVAALFIGLPLGALCVVRAVSHVVVVRFFKEIGQSDRENAKFFRLARRARAPTAPCAPAARLKR